MERTTSPGTVDRRAIRLSAIPTSSSSSRASDAKGLKGRTASVESCGGLVGLDVHHTTPTRADATPVPSAMRNKRRLFDNKEAAPCVGGTIAGSRGDAGSAANPEPTSAIDKRSA